VVFTRRGSIRRRGLGEGWVGIVISHGESLSSVGGISDGGLKSPRTDCDWKSASRRVQSNLPEEKKIWRGTGEAESRTKWLHNLLKEGSACGCIYMLEGGSGGNREGTTGNRPLRLCLINQEGKQGDKEKILKIFHIHEGRIASKRKE